MPTAAKLFAAVVFMALAWILTLQVRAAMPESGGMALFAPVNALVGLVIGWRLSGTRAGRGITSAVGDGLTTICVMYFWALLIWSGYEMVKRSVRLRYEGPIEAIQDMADLAVEYSADVITPGFVAVAVIGSVICGILTELISRRWP